MEEFLNAVHKTLESLDVAISSNNEPRACEISGLIEDKVSDLSAVPYLCLTSADKSQYIGRNHVRTITFSSDGESSSSSVDISP